MIDRLKELDTSLLLALNGSDSLFWDGVMMVITSTWVYIPLFVSVLYVIFRNRTLKTFFVTLLAIALTVALCDQFASGLCKPLFERFRPTQDPSIMYLVDIVDGYRGGRYGFISSHAANTFGICMFLSLLFRRGSFTLLMCVWASLSSWSRIYLGVHYPGDILCGLLAGLLFGYLVHLLYRRVLRSIGEPLPAIRRASSGYTSSGFPIADVRLPMLVLLFTYALIPVIAILKSL